MVFFKDQHFAHETHENSVKWDHLEHCQIPTTLKLDQKDYSQVLTNPAKLARKAELDL